MPRTRTQAEQEGGEELQAVQPPRQVARTARGRGAPRGGAVAARQFPAAPGAPAATPTEPDGDLVERMSAVFAERLADVHAAAEVREQAAIRRETAMQESINTMQQSMTLMQ